MWFVWYKVIQNPFDSHNLTGDKNDFTAFLFLSSAFKPVKSTFCCCQDPFSHSHFVVLWTFNQRLSILDILTLAWYPRPICPKQCCRLSRGSLPCSRPQGTRQHRGPCQCFSSWYISCSQQMLHLASRSMLSIPRSVSPGFLPTIQFAPWKLSENFLGYKVENQSNIKSPFQAASYDSRENVGPSPPVGGKPAWGGDFHSLWNRGMELGKCNGFYFYFLRQSSGYMLAYCSSSQQTCTSQASGPAPSFHETYKFHIFGMSLKG